ncbi:nitroreductase [Aneurinibacillus migulanus]|uniref:Putative NAD(P)H nitroreductase n=1 Tax=Aneurinibacillus migulanus TaxID=47500 RepID=A0A0D1XU16_ANEMI|nr:nitroreductase [Aneurinibacillus migulanus]KIV57706.1 nitroreductase [Aneurinibacillus migulanus]KIV58601.1 nitroreductase [Aneurinibacillus migulanus]KON96284.1 nitroreductase [Aneurinibacillus migulanus]KPD09300.1 nitroreductase [Aneurinibacillus migulanus]MCP1358320.1 nitroreductase [Aneurinibacillus migulanus]
MAKLDFPVAKMIQERRSIKKFKNEAISMDLLHDLLNVAVWAPNHRMREPWRFILFIEEGKRTLAEAICQHAMKKRDPVQLAEYFSRIPVHMLIVMQEDPRQREWEEDFAATSALIQNLQLAAWEQGIGMIWKTDPYIHSPGFRECFDIKPGERIVGLLHIGYPEEVPEAKARTKAELKITLIGMPSEVGV